MLHKIYIWPVSFHFPLQTKKCNSILKNLLVFIMATLYACMTNIINIFLNASVSDSPDGEVFYWMWLAFASDFKNGEVKEFMRHMCRAILEVLDLKKYFVLSPASSSTMNSRCINTPDPEAYEYSSPPSIDSNDAEEKHGFAVSDLLVFHPFQPFFLLAFECREGSDIDINKAATHLLRQLLTRMHHQTLVFGIVLTPLKWRLLVVQKTEASKHINIKQMECNLYEDDDILNYTFCTNSFINLLRWIQRIIQYQDSNIDSLWLSPHS